MSVFAGTIMSGTTAAPTEREYAPKPAGLFMVRSTFVCAACKGLYGEGVVHQCKEKKHGR